MDIFAQFGRKSAEERRRIASRRHEDFDNRLALNQTRRIWTERGINLEELESTTIPDTVTELGWEQFVETPGSFHPELVKEFYAAMVPEVFHAKSFVWVGGSRVYITEDAINEYLQTEGQRMFDVNEGLPRHAFFENSHDARVASALRRNAEPAWIPGMVELKYNELHPDLAMWLIFIKHNLLPSRNRTDVMSKDGQLLYGIQQELPIDVGRIIFRQILDAGRTRGSLPFPCLITHFCRVAQIPAASVENELMQPMSNINRRSYNTFCRTNRLPLLPTEGAAQAGQPNPNPQNNEPQGNEEPEHAEMPPPHPPVMEQGMDQFNWQQMYTLVQQNHSILTNMQQTNDTRYNEYVADRNEMRQRMADMQHFMNHHGMGYSRRPRDPAAGPSSQHPGSSSRYPGDQQ